MKSNYLNLVGLAYRARKCSTGEETIIKDIQQKKAKLLLIANDIGPQTHKKLTDKCKTYNIPYATVVDRETLAKTIGQSQRVTITILYKGLVHKIQYLQNIYLNSEKKR